MVTELLKRVMENRTVIMVSHDHQAHTEQNNSLGTSTTWRVLELNSQ
jgi:ABC-type lipoprotein export system ATPase subunit